MCDARRRCNNRDCGGSLSALEGSHLLNELFNNFQDGSSIPHVLFHMQIQRNWKSHPLLKSLVHHTTIQAPRAKARGELTFRPFPTLVTSLFH